MKKIFLLAMAAITTSAAFSQVNWAVQVHGNLASSSLKGEGTEALEKSSQLGFGAGVLANVNLANQLSLRTSLNLLQKGGKFSFNGSGMGGEIIPSVDATNKLYYAELPVNLVYNVNLSSGTLYFGAGPSLGYGLFGKTKVSYSNPLNPSEKETEESDAFKKEEDGGAGLKRFDFSANAIAGYQFGNGLFVNAGYLLGFSNLIDGEDDASMKNRGLQLTVGFQFGGKK